MAGPALKQAQMGTLVTLEVSNGSCGVQLVPFSFVVLHDPRQLGVTRFIGNKLTLSYPADQAYFIQIQPMHLSIAFKQHLIAAF